MASHLALFYRVVAQVQEKALILGRSDTLRVEMPDLGVIAARAAW